MNFGLCSRNRQQLLYLHASKHLKQDAKYFLPELCTIGTRKSRRRYWPKSRLIKPCLEKIIRARTKPSEVVCQIHGLRIPRQSYCRPQEVCSGCYMFCCHEAHPCSRSSKEAGIERLHILKVLYNTVDAEPGDREPYLFLNLLIADPSGQRLLLGEGSTQGVGVFHGFGLWSGPFRFLGHHERLQQTTVAPHISSTSNKPPLLQKTEKTCQSLCRSLKKSFLQGAYRL